MSSLILGQNSVEIQRGMTTSSTAIFVPFMTRELCMGGEALYYGMNALSHNVIMADRKKLINPNGIYLGQPGSGKSFKIKEELIHVVLTTNDKMVIVDIMGEYVPLVRRLGADIAEVIEISPDSPHHINPLDINLGSGAHDENPFAMKADFILSLMELVVGGRYGLEPVERTVIDRCTRLVYQDVLQNPTTARMPILQDLYELLKEQPEPEAKRLATALEIYCVGSLNVFNHQTNVSTDKRVTCIVLNKLGAGLHKIAMHITNELSLAAVSRNFKQGLYTWCVYDEFHRLLVDPLTASYFVSVWKMLRKKACIPTALTQNVADLLASREIENILEVSDFLILLSQAHRDREILAKKLSISPHQLSYITHSSTGEGLLFYGGTTIPFVDRFSKDTEIYRLLTTRPEDVHQNANTG
jgi:type IV secretory pathway VirB4 component